MKHRLHRLLECITWTTSFLLLVLTVIQCFDDSFNNNILLRLFDVHSTQFSQSLEEDLGYPLLSCAINDDMKTILLLFLFVATIQSMFDVMNATNIVIPTFSYANFVSVLCYLYGFTSQRVTIIAHTCLLTSFCVVKSIVITKRARRM